MSFESVKVVSAEIKKASGMKVPLKSKKANAPIPNEVDRSHVPALRNLYHRRPNGTVGAVLNDPLLLRARRSVSWVERDKVAEHAESRRRVDRESRGLG